MTVSVETKILKGVKKMRDLRPGDVVHCQGIVCTIKEIAWQEPWEWRKAVSAKYCYITHELRLHQNDRCKRFTPV